MSWKHLFEIYFRLLGRNNRLKMKNLIFWIVTRVSARDYTVYLNKIVLKPKCKSNCQNDFFWETIFEIWKHQCLYFMFLLLRFIWRIFDVIIGVSVFDFVKGLCLCAGFNTCFGDFLVMVSCHIYSFFYKKNFAWSLLR